MKIKSMHVDAFMAIGQAKVSLADKGFVLLQGENLDDTSANSNGSGKSSIADAFMWCMTGETARGETGDSVINNKLGVDACVECHIMDDTQEYKIDRTRTTGGKNIVIVNTRAVDVHPVALPWVRINKGNTKMTQELIYNILGCTKDVLLASVYAAQDGMIDLPRMPDKALKEIVESAAGMDKLAVAQKEASAAALEAESLLQEKQEDYSLALRRVSELKSTIETATEAHEKFVENIDSEREKLSENLRNLYKAQRDLDTRREELDYDPDEFDKVKAEMLEIKTRNKDRADKLLEIITRIAKAESALNQMRRDELILTSKVEMHKEYLANFIRARDDTRCESCGTKIDTSEENEKEVLRSEERITMAKLDVESQIEAIEVQSNKLTVLRSDLSVVDSPEPEDLESYETMQERKTEASSLSLQETSLEKMIEEAKQEMDAFSEISPMAEKIKETTKELRNARATMARRQVRVERAKEELYIANSVHQVFKPSGVRASIIDQVTPYLNERTSDYLSAISDDNIHAEWRTQLARADGTTRESFHIDVKTNSAGQSYKSLSGGEKRKVKLACCLALQDLIAQRAEKSIDLFIADEIDDALDTAGLERLMVMLEQRAKEKGTLLVISHNDLKDWARSHATVTKQHGTSTIRGALNETVAASVII